MKTQNQNKFYVYCHQRKDDGKCFYIGKGCGRRYKEKGGRNSFWKNMVNKHGGFIPLILINNISEQKAFQMEYLICKEIGYDNLCNIMEVNGWGGWSGSNGTKRTDEIKLKLSLSHGKPILQYDLDGKFIKRWPNRNMAGNTLNINNSSIGMCCKNKKYKKAGGFIWKFEDDENKNFQFNFSDNKKYKSIIQYDLEGNFIREWKSSTEIKNMLGMDAGNISSCCNNKRKQSYGYIWEFKNKI